MDKYYSQIEWVLGTPRSKLFNDIYHSIESEINESEYVFLEHNNLKQRFIDLKPENNFIIAETGFGAGINFFSTCRLWNKYATTNAQLHYISIEKYPLSPADLSCIIDKFTEFRDLKNEFIAQYYLLMPGYHRIFISNNIFLTLIIGNVIEVLPELDFKAHAWFLDGFSPDKNHEMWNKDTLKNIARLSTLNTTFAAYTAASQVRQDLIDSGFSVSRDNGYGMKREMLYGCYNHEASPIDAKTNKSYYAYPQSNKSFHRKTVAIIGAGISGAATAHSLARRGYVITVFEKNSQVAQEASGNYQGMLYGTWSIFGGTTMELSSSAYRLSNYIIKQHLNEDTEFKECGIFQLDHNEKQSIRNQQLLQHNFPNDFITKLSPTELGNNLIGIKQSQNLDGVFFPRGMWLQPPQLVTKLLDHKNITIKTKHNILDIEQQDDESWLIKTAVSEHKFDIIILCNSFLVDQFNITKYIQLRKIRGQTTNITTTTKLQTVICGDGYITPAVENKFTIGATFDFKNIHTEITTADHISNIEHLKILMPDIYSQIDISLLEGKASIRSSYTDYLPIVGPITDEKWFNHEYQRLTKDKNTKFTTNCQYIPNLYVNVGHGSKGILTAPICGEIIADYIDNTPPIVSESLRQSLHPNRVLVKNLVKNMNK